MIFLSYLNVFNPAICLALNAMLQVTIMRVMPNVGLLKSIFISFFFGIICLISLEASIVFRTATTINSHVSSFAVNLIAYAAFGYCYFHFLNLGETARRIRILRELHDSPEGLSMDEILNRYNARIIIQARIKRLIDNKQVTLRDGRLYIGLPVMLFMAKIIVLMKFFILGTKTIDSAN